MSHQEREALDKWRRPPVPRLFFPHPILRPLPVSHHLSRGAISLSCLCMYVRQIMGDVTQEKTTRTTQLLTSQVDCRARKTLNPKVKARQVLSLSSLTGKVLQIRMKGNGAGV